MTTLLRSSLLLLLALLLMWGCSSQEEEEAAPAAAEQAPAEEEEPVEPPMDVDVATIQWETNMEAPEYGSAQAKRGGTFVMDMDSFPQTFRLVGPNSNEAFANWNNAFGLFPLVSRHFDTDEFVPVLASHWYVAKDNRTVYYKLNPDVRWSDGKPVTADDYVFGFEFMKDPRIVDPFMNGYVKRLIAQVDKIDDHTIRIAARKESWRPLMDTSAVLPFPRHAINLDVTDGKEWIVRANYTPPVTVGPYVIDTWKEGEFLSFKRLNDWWGDNQRYLKNQFNPDFITLKVVPDMDRSFDFLKRGELDFLQIGSARQWATQINFPALEKGWVKARVVYNEAPQGVYGIGFNLNAPVMKDEDFRIALQHLFNFDELNKELMFNAYYRQPSIFQGTEFMNKDIQPRAFDPAKAREHLTKAGYTKRGADGIMTKDNGQRASFTLLYGNPSIEAHLTVVQNIFRRGGVEMKLQRLEPSAAFERLRDKATEAFLVSMTASFYPEPFQYFHSTQAFDAQGKVLPQTNNFWSFADPEVDKLIETYMHSMDAGERRAAMAQIDKIVADRALLITFWYAPYVRILYWDYLEWPEDYFPRRSSGIMESWVFWIDEQKREQLKEAMQSNQPVAGEGGPIDIDPYGVKARITSQ